MSLGEVGTQFDQQKVQWMVRCLVKLKQLELYDAAMKSVQIPIDPVSRTGNLPKDFDNEGAMVQIGICRLGRLINFDKNPTLCDPTEVCPCHDPDKIANIINACCGDGTSNTWPLWAYPLYAEPYSYSYTAGSYAIGPGFYGGGYKFFLNKGIVAFDQCVKAESFVLVYFGDFMTDSGNALIPNDFVQILIDWMEYCKKRFSPDKMTRREAPEAYNFWLQGVRDYVAKQQQLNEDGWLRLFRRLSFQGVKA